MLRLTFEIGTFDEIENAYPLTCRRSDGAVESGGWLRIDRTALRAILLYPAAYGKALGEALLAEQNIRDFFAVTAGNAGDDGLAIQIAIADAAAELHALHWERLLLDFPAANTQVARDAQTPFSRFSDRDVGLPTGLTNRPLRLLFAVCYPADLAEQYADVRVEDQVRTIAEAVGPQLHPDTISATIMPGRSGLSEALRADLVEYGFAIVEGPTTIDKVIRETADHHVLHLIAHGRRERNQDERGLVNGVLIIEDEVGYVDGVKDVEFAVKLGNLDHERPNLVFLGACNTAQAEGTAENPHVGFAPHLIQHDIPAVVAMQSLLQIDLLQELTKDFYQGLIEHGVVDRALNQSRNLLPGDDLNEAFPVLFMRLREGLLFEPEKIPAEKIPLTRTTLRPWADQKLELILKSIEKNKLYRLLAIILTLIPLLTFIYSQISSPDSDTAPVPPMSGGFNVAVAEFGELDLQGGVEESREGQRLASDVYDNINDVVRDLEAVGFNIEVREPQLIGTVPGTNNEERAANAKALAEQINADLIIYGNLSTADDASSLMPEFYISSAKLINAEELDGQYEFGSTLQVRGNINRNIVSRGEMDEQLANRAKALARFVIGLSYFGLDRFDEAARYFDEVKNDEGWDDAEGKEVLYLFLGSTAVKRHDLLSAEDHYAKALKLDDRYARALLGAAQIDYLRARDQCQPGQVDVAGMERALDGYDQALRSAHPPLANIPLKVSLLRGRLLTCLSIAEEGVHWEDAEEEYEIVLEAYNREPENSQLKNLAAEASADLGLIDILLAEDGDTEAWLLATEAYQEAVDLSLHPERQATFYLWLAQIHLYQEQCSQAEDDLTSATTTYDDFTQQNPHIQNPSFEQFRQQIQQRLQSC